MTVETVLGYVLLFVVAWLVGFFGGKDWGTQRMRKHSYMVDKFYQEFGREVGQQAVKEAYNQDLTRYYAEADTKPAQSSNGHKPGVGDPATVRAAVLEHMD